MKPVVIIPPEKAPLQQPSWLPGVARWLGVAGLTGYGIVMAMILSDHPSVWPWHVLGLAGLGVVSLLIAWPFRRVGGLLLAVCMGGTIFVLPPSLADWRPILTALAGFLVLVGVVLIWKVREL